MNIFIFLILFFLTLATFIFLVMGIFLDKREFGEVSSAFKINEDRRMLINLIVLVPMVPLYLGRLIRRLVIFLIFKESK